MKWRAATYVDRGLGFPVVLLHVPMVKVRGEWTPNIDYNQLSLVVLEALCHKPARLTGDEVRFIRQHAEMTLQAFAQRFGVKHPAVIKWERKGRSATGMAWSTEKDIRLFVWKALKGKRQLGELYVQLESQPTRVRFAIEVDGRKVAA